MHGRWGPWRPQLQNVGIWTKAARRKGDSGFLFFFLLCIATRLFFSLTWRRLFVHGARSRELSAQGLLRKFCRPGEAGVSSQAAGVSVWKDEQWSGDLGLRRQLPDGRAVAFSLTL